MTEIPPRYLTDNEVSELTSIPVKTLRNHRHIGRGLPYKKLAGSRHVRYLLSEILAYMDQNSIRPEESPSDPGPEST